MAAQHKNRVSMYAAGARLPQLLEKVEAGEEVTITKHGIPMAKLVPIKKEVHAGERAAAIRRIQTLAIGLRLSGLKVKDLIRKGQR